MPPAKKDINLYKGDSFQLFLRIRRKMYDANLKQMVNGPGKDLTGMKVKATVRTSPGAPEVLCEFQATVPDQAIEANLGFVLLGLTPAQTSRLPGSANFPTPTLHYDVRVMDDGDDPQFAKTYLRGQIAVQESIS